MKGLDASILPASKVADLNPGFRIDAEFFARPVMEALGGIRRARHEPLGTLCSRIQHPIEVKREYEDDGLLTIMAKNVRPNRVELFDPRFMPEDLRTIVARNRLQRDDVLVTRTGANFGQSASWKDDTEAFACADILILREPSLPSGYLSSFLESSAGKPLVLRGGYGAGQPHIAPPYLAGMPVPRFGALEGRVDETVENSVRQERLASATLVRAEREILTAIGLDGWTPPDPLNFTARASAAVTGRRLDARFYAPRVQALLERLGADNQTIGDVARPRRQRFDAVRHADFNYIEIGDVDSSGAAMSTVLPAADAPSRATWYVRPGDIITSLVRPIRRLTAQVAVEQDGYVCSSGFAVVECVGIAPEVLLTYLRLPIICELLDLYASASMYPAITDADIFALPLPKLAAAVTESVTEIVKEARAARARAVKALEAAKRAVELAIASSEDDAMSYLDQVEGGH